MTQNTNPKPPYQLKVLAMIKEKQQQHGLRHGDYKRYQQYVTRKLARLRKSLHFPQGDRRRVLPKAVTLNLVSQDVRYLQIKLFLTESAWARANQLKAEANMEPRKRFNQMSRLRKAVKHVEELSALAQNHFPADEANPEGVPVCDARSILEVQAYTAYILGLQQFEFQSWHKAKDLLEKSQNIYRGLAEAVEEEERAMYLARAEELVPQIRYSAYNIGDRNAVQDLRSLQQLEASGVVSGEELDQLLSQARANQAQVVVEVKWLNQLVVPVKNEKAKLAVLTMQDAQSDLQQATTPLKSKVVLCESIMKACVEAMGSVRDEIRLDPNQKTVPNLTTTASVQSLAPDKMSRLQLLYVYLAYVKLAHTVERNLALIHLAQSESSTKPQELARLYDAVTQCLQEMSGLPGVCHHPPSLEEVQARLGAYRAWRSYYLALTYMQTKKFTEAGAILKRVYQRHCREVTESVRTLMKSASSGYRLQHLYTSLDGLVTAMGQLATQSEAEELACRASRVLSLVQEEKAGSGGLSLANEGDLTHEEREALKKKPLMDRLSHYMEDPSLLSKTPNLLRLPPDFEPIPTKPIFFDLALNHVQYPDLDDKLAGNKTQAAAGGGGLMGWLWGGKKK